MPTYKKAVQTTQFVEKSFYQYITTIEKSYYDKNPLISLQNYFGKDFFYKSWNIAETTEYYQHLLIMTNSIEIKHHFNKDNIEYAFFNFKIVSIMTPEQWQKQFGSLSEEIDFPAGYNSNLFSNVSFNYWDYQQAWYNSLYFQNSRGSHT